MKTKNKWWIKQRFNPQTGTYFVREGQLSKRVAAKMEGGAIYGSNHMIPYDTKEEMEAAYEAYALEGSRCL